MPQRKRILGILFTFALFNGLSPLLSRADTWAAFGPQTYTRGSGAPVTSTDTITLPHPGTQYTLRIFNGGLEHNHALFVSNCEVRLNGVWIAGPKKCNHTTSEVSIPITPLVSNTLSVTVRGRKGSTLAIEIIGVDNDPPTISATIDPPPDAAGWNSSAVKVTFTCADALSGVASCSPPVALSSEVVGKIVTGMATDVAGNTATVSASVNISFKFFKIQSWETGPNGNPSSPFGRCLDYGKLPSGIGASVFLNDCDKAKPVRVEETGDRPGNGIDPSGQPIVLHHEVMLFAGNQVIGIHNPPAQTVDTPCPEPTTQSEFSLELQIPWNSPDGPLKSCPANQIFRLDGDSIILESTSLDANLAAVPGPCINTTASTTLCPTPPPQIVIQIQNARGAIGSPIVAGVRNLSDNEFWDFIPLPGSRPDPTTGFISTVADTPITTNWQLWNAICADTPQATPASPPPVQCHMFNVGWGSVVVVAGSDPKECSNQPPEVGPCIDFSGGQDANGHLAGYPPVVIPAGVTIRGNRRGTSLGPQLFAAFNGEKPTDGLCGWCVLDVRGDYARVTGLRLRGQSRSFDGIDENARTDGVQVDFAFPPPPPTRSVLSTVTEFIATIDHNDASDWEDAAVSSSSPFFNRSDRGNRCGYTGYSDPTPPNTSDPKDKDTYACDENFRFKPEVPFSRSLGLLPVRISEDTAGPLGTGTLANMRVARNFLHHNRRDGGGYGVGVQGRALIEGNTFVWNRHDISAAAEPHAEYRASHNLVLSSAYGGYGDIHGNGRLQDFDMHGTGNPHVFADGAGGYFVEIDGNTFLGHKGGTGGTGHDYALRGYPIVSTYYHDNRSLRTESDAVQFWHCTFIPAVCRNTCSSIPCDKNLLDFPINIDANTNQFKEGSPAYTNPTGQLGVGDFDGDGDDDLFLATGAAWYYSPGSKAEWRFLSAKTDRIDSLMLGDFDGDGRTDVVGMNPGGQLVVSWGGISDWEVLNQNPCPNSVLPPIKSCAISDMAVGKFLDHADGVPKDDLFLADGSNWYLSLGGSVPFSFVNNSSFRRSDVLFGDFDGDGKTDVFGIVFDTQHNVNSWSFTSKAAGDWIFLQAALPSPVKGTVKGLVVANFRGNMIADVGVQCGNGWKISSGGSQGWSGCNTFPSGFTLVNAGVGWFSGGKGADILLWNKSNGIDVFRAGTGPSGSLSTQDMR